MGVLPVNLNGRRFRGVVNYDDGDLTSDIVFLYHQDGSTVWGEFEGGRVAHGSLVARMDENGAVDMDWHYVTLAGEVNHGKCRSTPEMLPDGRIRLHEKWTTHAGEAGHSVIEEIGPSDQK